MKVVVIAFGTRGDVQPLVVLAAGIAARSPWCHEVVFVTHQSHAGFVEHQLHFCGEGTVKPQLATVNSPPVLWKGPSGSDAAEARANLAQQNGCVEACRGAGLVIFNLFALEGFHVSEAYKIPCARSLEPVAKGILIPGNTQKQRQGAAQHGRHDEESSENGRHQVIDSNLVRASDQQEYDTGIDADDTFGARTERIEGSGLPPDVEAFLSAREERPVYIGFGSMWTMCSPGYRLAFALRVLLVGARQAGSRCMVHLPAREAAGVGKGGFEGAETGDGSRLAELDAAMDWIWGEFNASAAQNSLLVFQGPLAHDLLLPRCSVAIHHGGSGTTAAVLRAGIPQVICPQQLDQFFWAERVRYLAVGSVLERSLFVEREPAPTEPSGPLICQAAAAILSVLTPQTKLRAACLGVKIRAEKGLENAVASLSLLATKRKRFPTVPTAPEAEPTVESLSQPQPQPQPRPDSVSAGKFAVQTSTARATSAVGHVATGSVEGGTASDSASGGRVSGGDGVGISPPGGGGGGRGVRLDEREKGEEQGLVLREMPNGLRVWWSSRGEEEAMFIFGEVFEDRTYARMGLRVQSGDTVWDVGANVGLASIFFELEMDTPDSVRLYAFEPLPLNSTALKRNLFMHCPTAVIQGYALGATHQDGVPATFYPRMPGNSTLKPLEKERLQGGMEIMAGGGPKGSFFYDAEQVTCDVRTVSWAMAKLDVDRIDLLKIDVEGAELDVMLGIEEKDWPKIRQVVAEVHPVGDRLPQTCRLLRDHGFDVSTQALGLDGTPISPSRGVNTVLDAPADAPSGISAANANTSTHSAAGTMALPRGDQQQPRLQQREDGCYATAASDNDAEAATRDTQSTPQDRQDRNRRCNSDVESGSANRNGREVGVGRSCDDNDVALDGVAFMVYAKRLPM
eukprot:g16335.t1